MSCIYLAGWGWESVCQDMAVELKVARGVCSHPTMCGLEIALRDHTWQQCPNMSHLTTQLSFGITWAGNVGACVPLLHQSVGIAKRKQKSKTYPFSEYARSPACHNPCYILCFT